MNWKRGILFGALLWVLIFFEVCVLMFGFNLKNGDLSYYILHYILLAILSIIATIFYFRGKRVARSFKEGFLLGVCFVIIGVILDAIITIPLFVKNYYLFFFDAGLWIGYLEGIVITCIIGSIRD